MNTGADLPTAGFFLWFTGLPSSGKSTLAERVALVLRARRVAVLVLDGDQLRSALSPAPGYDDASRDHFYETLANLACLAAAQGLVVLVAATANRRAYRDRARVRCGEARFAEVFVDTPPAVCATRDAKGLYRASRDGAVSDLPGVGAAYERPENPALTVVPSEHDAAERVAGWLLARYAP